MAGRIVVRATLGRVQILERMRAIAGERILVADDEAALVAGIAEAEAVTLTNPDYNAKVAAALHAAAPRVRWLQFLTAGTDALQQHGAPAGLVVTSAGDAYAPAVGAHAVSLLLALQRHFATFLANKNWDRSVAPKLLTPAEQVIAVLGFGGIGREVARLLRPFGARIVAVTRSATPHPLADEVEKIENLSAVLARADAVVVALPLDEATHGLIGTAALARMKPHAVLVNIARGSIVDSLALAAALKEGRIAAGAGLDVSDPEPLPPGHELWSAPNLIITPHVARACGPLAGARLAAVAGENLTRFLAGQPLAHIVPR